MLPGTLVYEISTLWGLRWCSGQTTRLPPSEPGSIPGRVDPGEFCMWESCRTMQLVGGFSRRSPVRHCATLTSLHPHRLSKTSMLAATQISSLTQYLSAPGRACLARSHRTRVRVNNPAADTCRDERGSAGMKVECLATRTCAHFHRLPHSLPPRGKRRRMRPPPPFSLLHKERCCTHPTWIPAYRSRVGESVTPREDHLSTELRGVKYVDQLFTTGMGILSLYEMNNSWLIYDSWECNSGKIKINSCRVVLTRAAGKKPGRPYPGRELTLRADPRNYSTAESQNWRVGQLSEEQATHKTTSSTSYIAEEYTTCIQVDNKQGFQKCPFYREQLIPTNLGMIGRRCFLSGRMLGGCHSENFDGNFRGETEQEREITDMLYACPFKSRNDIQVGFASAHVAIPRQPPGGNDSTRVTALARPGKDCRFSPAARNPVRSRQRARRERPIARLGPANRPAVAAFEVSIEQCRNEGAGGKREIPEKTRRSTASSGARFPFAKFRSEPAGGWEQNEIPYTRVWHRETYCRKVPSCSEEPRGAPYALKLQCDWPGTRSGMEPSTEKRAGPITKPVTKCHDRCRTGRYNGSYSRPCTSLYEIWYRVIRPTHSHMKRREAIAPPPPLATGTVACGEPKATRTARLPHIASEPCSRKFSATASPRLAQTREGGLSFDTSDVTPARYLPCFSPARALSRCSPADDTLASSGSLCHPSVSTCQRRDFGHPKVTWSTMMYSAGHPTANISQHAIANETQGPFPEPRATYQRMGTPYVDIKETATPILWVAGWQVGYNAGVDWQTAFCHFAGLSYVRMRRRNSLKAELQQAFRKVGIGSHSRDNARRMKWVGGGVSSECRRMWVSGRGVAETLSGADGIRASKSPVVVTTPASLSPPVRRYRKVATRRCPCSRTHLVTGSCRRGHRIGARKQHAGRRRPLGSPPTPSIPSFYSPDITSTFPEVVCNNLDQR
ncbi:hypothetical protein PR048_027648 [Dryococelus australis]|uniref:Uncharacterized protein n=1 Tax=Dryococelus australis TaxID=614101 RepID=A0ABQ9GH39_9NEOP|nr:hypothetical protein PR048_027648 [Dryococelus australis]